MRRWTTVLSLVALTLSLPPSAIEARSQPPYGVFASTHGVERTLALPRLVYPQNALVPATVSLQNRTHRRVWVVHFVGACGSLHSLGGIYGFGGPLNVVNAAGSILFPPALPSGPAPICVLPSTWLHSGQFLSERVLAILRAERLVAEVKVGIPNRAFTHWQDYTLTTPDLTVTLTPSVSPSVDLHTAGDNLSADIHPPSQARGHLFYMSWSKCSAAGQAEPTVGGRWLWTESPQPSLSVPCPGVGEWRAVAGWLGRPIASIDYRKQQPALPPERTHIP